MLNGGIASATAVGAGANANITSGGTLLNASVAPGGVELILSGGSAGASVVGGIEAVSNGGSAIDAAILGGGVEFVFGGGQTEGVVVSSGGLQVVSAAAVANDTLILSGGEQDVLAGGIAINATVADGGLQVVSSGGIADGTVLLAAGQPSSAAARGAGGAAVLSGGAAILPIGALELAFGTANDTTIEGGTLELAVGGSLGGAAVLFDGPSGVLKIDGAAAPANLISGFAGADAIDLAGITFDSTGSLSLSAGNMLVLSEGGQSYTLDFDPAQSFAEATFAFAADSGGGTRIFLAGPTVSAGNPETVSSGQTLQNITVLPGGIVVFFGTGEGTTISAGQSFVESGGSTNGTILQAGGDEFVELGGSTSGTLIADGSQEVFGLAVGTVISGVNARVDLYAGGTTLGTIVSSGVELVIGTASGTIDLRGGFDFVYGSAVETVASGGEEFIEVGAVASGTVVLSSGAQVVYGSANATVLNSGGTAYFLAGSIVSGSIVNSGLAVTIGTVTATVVASGSFDFVEPGGVALGAVLNGGDQYVESGGVATGTVIGNGGTQVDFGLGSGTVINSGGFQYVYPGGTASGTVVNQGGVDNIFVGLAVGTVDHSGGRISSIRGSRATPSCRRAGRSLSSLAAPRWRRWSAGRGPRRMWSAARHRIRYWSRAECRSSRRGRARTTPRPTPAATSLSPGPRRGDDLGRHGRDRRRRDRQDSLRHRWPVEARRRAAFLGHGGRVRQPRADRPQGHRLRRQHDVWLPGSRQQPERHADRRRRHSYRQPDPPRPIRRGPVPPRPRRRWRNPGLRYADQRFRRPRRTDCMTLR